MHVVKPEATKEEKTSKGIDYLKDIPFKTQPGQKVWALDFDKREMFEEDTIFCGKKHRQYVKPKAGLLYCVARNHKEAQIIFNKNIRTLIQKNKLKIVVDDPTPRDYKNL